MSDKAEGKLKLSSISEDSEEMDNDNVKQEEKSIKTNCDFINKFVDELQSVNLGNLSPDVKTYIDNMRTKISNWKSEDLKPKIKEKTTEVPAMKSEAKIKHSKYDKSTDSYGNQSSGSGTDSRESRRKTKKLKKKQKIYTYDSAQTEEDKKKKRKQKNDTDENMLRTLITKIDNRRVPKLSKFDENSGLSLGSYLTNFESYCEDNLKGSSKFWIDELEQHLVGDTLKALKSIKDVEDTYETMKEKLLSWYNDMKELRKKRYKEKFHKAKYNSGESLYLYSTKMEKLFHLAYPKHTVNSSEMLREQFIKTISKDCKKIFTDYITHKRLMDQKITWSMIQKCARVQDLEIEEKKREKKDTEEESDEVKEIEINIQQKVKNPNEEKYKNSSRNDRDDRNNRSPTYHRDNYPNSNRYSNYQSHAQNEKSNEPYRSERTYNGSRNNNFHYNNYRAKSYQNDHQNNYQRNKRFSSPPNTFNSRCTKCNRYGHSEHRCRLNVVGPCFNCGLMGHRQIDCYRNRRPNRTYNRSYSQPPENRYRSGNFSPNRNYGRNYQSQNRNQVNYSQNHRRNGSRERKYERNRSEDRDRHEEKKENDDKKYKKLN